MGRKIKNKLGGCGVVVCYIVMISLYCLWGSKRNSVLYCVEVIREWFFTLF